MSVLFFDVAFLRLAIVFTMATYVFIAVQVLAIWFSGDYQGAIDS